MFVFVSILFCFLKKPKQNNKLRIIFFLESQFRLQFIHMHSMSEGAGIWLYFNCLINVNRNCYFPEVRTHILCSEIQSYRGIKTLAFSAEHYTSLVMWKRKEILTLNLQVTIRGTFIWEHKLSTRSTKVTLK